jgi:hypothetical protein
LNLGFSETRFNWAERFWRERRKRKSSCWGFGPDGIKEAGKQEGVPLQKHEVQLGKRTGRKRGAPSGNRNRLTHGGYSGAVKAARRERSARRQEQQLLAAWTDVVWRLHRMECAGIDAPPGLGLGK